jgi:hypothetical protein
LLFSTISVAMIRILLFDMLAAEFMKATKLWILVKILRNFRSPSLRKGFRVLNIASSDSWIPSYILVPAWIV